MAYVKNIWVDQNVERPKTYEMTNNADGSVTLIDSFGLVTELGTPVNADNMNHIEEGIEGVYEYIDNSLATVDLSNLSAVGEAHFASPSLSNLDTTGQNILNSKLNTTQISNCILEAPHMVDVSLSDGVLTLAAGSKVIVPYGTFAPTKAIGDSLNGGTIVDISWNNSKLFYIVEYSSNLTHSAGYNRIAMYVINASGTINTELLTSHYSGVSAPTPSGNYAVWYDTANNIVKRTYDGGTTWMQYLSFPFAIVTETSVPTSIDQVFQSCGYIGSLIWVMKGVKVLIPDGRNSDGTLKNDEFTSSYICIGNLNDALAFRNNAPLYLYRNNTIGFLSNGFYDDITNYNYSSRTATNSSAGACIAYGTTNNTSGQAIVELKPHQTANLPTLDYVKTMFETSGNGFATFSKTSIGYMKFANGIILQWGAVGPITVNSKSAITFPVPFTSYTSYTLTSSAPGALGWSPVFSVADRAATGCSAYLSSAENKTSNVYCCWMAIGY